MASSRRAVLIVLDGFGIGKDSPSNAINNARMPFYRDLVKRYPHSQLLTHGEAVGLPEGVMGNSEVGHMTMGAGRIVYQDLTRISKAIRTHEFQKNTVLSQTFETGAKAGGRVHLMGLLSDGGVHSHLEHLEALLDLCSELRVPNVSVHCFMDGRDTPPNSGTGYLRRLLKHSAFSGGPGQTRAVIATVSGRYFAMDRDKRWDRVQKAYLALTGQVPVVPGGDALQVVEASYAAGKSDEFIEPMLLNKEAAIQAGDSVVFFNYRADRAREISEALSPELRGVEFTHFDRGPLPPRISAFCGMTVYDRSIGLAGAYEPQNLNNIFGSWLEQKQLKQFRVAETEKYAHVTFFFNGGREAAFIGEDRALIQSPRDVATYDLKPEMSGLQVAEEAAARIASKAYDFVLMNFANADMVGHTGNYEATLKAMETLDLCLGKVVGAAERSNYHTLITADHGNAEEMIDCNGHLHTQHTLNPVPAIWVEPNSAIAPRSSRRSLQDGGLQDIMPTLCALMGLPLPPEATGKSLLPRN